MGQMGETALKFAVMSYTRWAYEQNGTARPRCIHRLGIHKSRYPWTTTRNSIAVSARVSVGQAPAFQHPSISSTFSSTEMLPSRLSQDQLLQLLVHPMDWGRWPKSGMHMIVTEELPCLLIRGLGKVGYSTLDPSRKPKRRQ